MRTRLALRIVAVLAVIPGAAFSLSSCSFEDLEGLDEFLGPVLCEAGLIGCA